MIVDIDPSAGVVAKKASTPAEAVRLRREADVLGQARHPGVVELIGLDEPSVLRLALVDGRPLEGHHQLTAAEIAALGVGVATTLADLHDIGIVHGELTAEHVLIEPGGRPILCSFGHGAAAEPADDVAAVGRLLRSCRREPLNDTLQRAIAQATRADPRRRPSMRALARTLAAASSGPRRRPTRRLVLGAIGLLLAMLLGASLSHPWTRSARVAVPCPPVDHDCGPISRPGGVLTTASGRYQLSEPSDPVVLGRWTCTATAFLALLRPNTGEVWVWDAWPRRHAAVTARLIARVPQALSLRVASTASGCDRLVVSRATGPSIPIDPAEPPRGTN